MEPVDDEAKPELALQAFAGEDAVQANDDDDGASLPPQGWDTCVACIRFFIDRVASNLDPLEALKLQILNAVAYNSLCD